MNLLKILLVLGLAGSSVALGDDCATWVRRFVGTPGKRVSPAMAYDSDRGITIFFGGEYSDAGSSTITYYNDTWEYDGVSWRIINTGANTPSPRSGHAMAYDSNLKRVVLFGGANGNGYLNDTWVYTDPGTWTKLPILAPVARAGHALVYDSSRKATILIGGNHDGIGLLAAENEFWELNQQGWFQPTGVDPVIWQDHFESLLDGTYRSEGRSRLAAVYDSGRNIVVTFGGAAYSTHLDALGDETITGTSLYGGTFEFDGRWSEVKNLEPLPRQQHAMAYDSQRGLVIMFGGVNDKDSGGTDEPIGNETDEYLGGVGWRHLYSLAQVPPPRARHAMVFDSKRGVVVMFGGVSGDERYDDTWEFVSTGPTFTQQPTNQMVQPCSSASFRVEVSGDPPQTFHWAKDGQPLTDGGRFSGVLSNTLTITETQFADEGYYSASVTSPCGTNSSIGAQLNLSMPWTLIWTNGPEARSSHAMAYDSRRGVTVLFGGAGSSGVYGDTWEWNGNTWLLRATNGPSPRFGASMAYDSSIGKILLVGGNVGAQVGVFDPLHWYRAGTWEWDGVNWTLRTTNGPSGRKFAAIAFDSQSGRTILWGGFGLTGPFRPDSPGVSQVQLSDTWEYDARAKSWTQVASGGPPPSNGAMAFDSQRNRRVLFTDNNGPYGFINTWEWAGTNWTAVSPLADPDLPGALSMPSKLAGEAIAYHSGRGQIIINNGGNPFGYDRSTWAYNGESWKQLSSGDGPRQEGGGQMAYDEARSALVQYGGGDNVGYFSAQTWELVDADSVQILKQPVSVSTGTNQLVRFSVTTRGKPLLQYQWRSNGVNLTDGGTISGATSGILTIANAEPGTDSATYDVVISNDCGSMTSVPASLRFVSAGLVLQPTHGADGLRLNWSPIDAVLESAPQLAGPWDEVVGASTPYLVVTDQPSRFYRLRQR